MSPSLEQWSLDKALMIPIWRIAIIALVPSSRQPWPQRKVPGSRPRADQMRQRCRIWLGGAKTSVLTQIKPRVPSGPPPARGFSKRGLNFLAEQSPNTLTHPLPSCGSDNADKTSADCRDVLAVPRFLPPFERRIISRGVRVSHAVGWPSSQSGSIDFFRLQFLRGHRARRL